MLPKAESEVATSGANLLSGTVRHRRYTPTEHSFSYKTSYLWLDIQNLNSVFDRCVFWSLEKANLVSFRQADFFDDEPGSSLFEKLSTRIKRDTGDEFSGSIYLLAHLRYWGHQFNPVVFYYCFTKGHLKYIVAEINNTPWDEKFSYVLSVDQAEHRKQGPLASGFRFVFSKSFHVSPFMPMDLEYDWRFYDAVRGNGNSDDGLQHTRTIHMMLKQDKELVFDATLQLQASDLSKQAMYSLPFRYGLVTIKTITAIYWQALRLWLKKVPFYPYPSKQVTHIRKENDH